MHLQRFIPTLANFEIYNQSIHKIQKSLFFIFKDLILAWPRAIVISMPHIFSNIKIILSTKDSFSPHIYEISQLAWALFRKVPSAINKIETFTTYLAHLSQSSEAMTAEGIFQTLDGHRKKWQDLGLFIKACLLPTADDLSEDQIEFIPEFAKTAALLNALVDDLSSRTGFFSINKEPQEGGCEIAAKAQAVVIKEVKQEENLSPLNPYEQTVSLDETPVVIIEEQQSLIFETKTQSAVAPVILQQQASVVVIHTADEQQLLNYTKNLAFSKHRSLADTIVAFVYFIAIDILWGVPKFLIYDLPQMIFDIETSSASAVSCIHPTAEMIIELKQHLKGLHKLSESWDKIVPVINGIELYLAKNLKEDAICLNQQYQLVMASISNALITIDMGQIDEIKKQMKHLLSKINPLLIKILDSLKGRSLASVITRPSPSLKGPSKTAQTSSSSSSSSDSVEGAPQQEGLQAKVQEGAQKVGDFFKRVGSGLKTGLTPKPTS